MRYQRFSRHPVGPLVEALGPKGQEPTLCDDVERTFERALSEKDAEVAEYLLCALEAIARREENEAALDSAYWALTCCPRPHRTS